MHPPDYDEKDRSLFSLDTLCYPARQPRSPKYLASTKKDHLFGVQYQPLPRPQYQVVPSAVQKMGPVNPDIRYHVVQHQSDDEDARQDERLLVPDEDDAPTSPPRARTIRFHITACIRVLICILCIPSFICCFEGSAAVAGAFLVTCLVRNVYVLLSYVFSRFISMKFLNIQIIIGPSGGSVALGQAKSNGKSFMLFVAILIDFSIALSLLLSVPLSFGGLYYQYGWSKEQRQTGLILGCIIA
jgi:hypothetical protein